MIPRVLIVVGVLLLSTRDRACADAAVADPVGRRPAATAVRGRAGEARSDPRDCRACHRTRSWPPMATSEIHDDALADRLLHVGRPAGTRAPDALVGPQPRLRLDHVRPPGPRDLDLHRRRRARSSTCSTRTRSRRWRRSRCRLARACRATSSRTSPAAATSTSTTRTSVVTGTTNQHIYVVAETPGSPGFTLAHDYDLSGVLRSGEKHHLRAARFARTAVVHRRAATASSARSPSRPARST